MTRFALTPPAGFASKNADDVCLGDVVWYQALQQSRTGFIVRAPVRGQVTGIWPVMSRIYRWSSAVTLELRLPDGTRRACPLRRRDLVFVQERLQSEVAS